jgi:AmiR/NasT family two-component response regulator
MNQRHVHGRLAQTRARSSSCMVISKPLTTSAASSSSEVRALIDEPIESERCTEQLRAAVERAGRRRRALQRSPAIGSR